MCWQLRVFAILESTTISCWKQSRRIDMRTACEHYAQKQTLSRPTRCMGSNRRKGLTDLKLLRHSLIEVKLNKYIFLRNGSIKIKALTLWYVIRKVVQPNTRHLSTCSDVTTSCAHATHIRAISVSVWAVSVHQVTHAVLNHQIVPRVSSLDTRGRTASAANRTRLV